MPSIGIKNKNYLNLKNGTTPWSDAAGESGTDAKGHAVFTDPAWGIRAAIIQLRSYYFKHNRRTIAEILARWAPSTDTIGSIPGAPPNSPVDYAAFVATKMGIGAMETLDIFAADQSIGNIARLRALVYAMAAYEIGDGFVVPDDEFNAGLELVAPGILGTPPENAEAAAAAPTAAETDAAFPLALTGSVGRADKGAKNVKDDVIAVQEMLRDVSLILGEPAVDPGAADGEISANASKSSTVKAIVAFQGRFMAHPDGVIGVGGRTWREMVAVLRGDDEPEPSDATKFFFPFDHLPSNDWAAGMARFGSNRSGGRRAHAACDLYYPKGTVIHAIADGTVVRGPYFFYLGTYALEVDHGQFVARYGEIQAQAFVREGDRVRAGQPIARVGHLVGISVPSDMLHLELYDKTATGPLNVGAAQSRKRADGVPFLRRRDLIDPTPFLKKWKDNLPGD